MLVVADVPPRDTAESLRLEEVLELPPFELSELTSLDALVPPAATRLVFTPDDPTKLASPPMFELLALTFLVEPPTPVET